MYLKAVEIQGFKSFPDKTVVEFQRGMTSIVGPNGSGKSNISDAIRWVLGEQSSKTLRGTKMEDVVFAGTKSRKPLSFAVVTLLLNNEDRSLAVDADEVAITRKYYRSGESEYQINKNNVRLKDVHELLMDTGLGRDGYSIIGQGKIAEIVSAKSGERREIFEEAAGISKYRYRKEEAEKRLALAEENMERLRDIAGELESRVGPLKEQSDKAKRFLELAARKKNLEINLWLDTLDRSGGVLRDVEQKIYIADSQYADLDKGVEDTERQIEQLYLSMQQCTVDAENGRAQLEAFREEIADKNAAIAVTENSIEHQRQSIAAAEQELAQWGQRDEDTDQLIALKRAERERKEQEITLLEQRLSAAQAAYEQAAGSGRGTSEEIDRLTQELAALNKRGGEYRVTLFSAEAAAKELAERAAAVDAQLEALEAQQQALRAADRKAQDALEEAQEEQQSFLNMKKGLAMRRQLAQEKADEAKKAYDAAAARDREYEQKIRVLTGMLNSMEGFSHSVRELMKQAKSGALRGVHGVLGSLIQVNRAYTTAVETALGAAMQNIVVDNEGSAKAGIAWLKKTGAGRATFLPLTSVKDRGRLTENLQGMDGFVGIAADLVKTDPRYRPIVNSFLSRTAVTEDIDSAIRMAKQFGYRFRIVTLDGQLCNQGGSMTGGSLVKGAGLLSRAGEIEQLRQARATLQDRLKTLEADCEKKQSDLAVAAAETDSVDAELKTAEETVLRLQYEADAARRACTEGAQRIDDLSKERESAAQRLKELEQSRSEAEREMKGLTAGIDTLTAKLEGLTDQSRQISEQLRTQNEEIADRRMEILSARKDSEGIGAEIELLQERKIGSLDRRNRLLEDKRQLEEGIAAGEAEIAALKEAITALEGRIADKRTEIDGLQNRRDQLEKTQRELRDSIKDVSQKKEDLTREKTRLEERKNALQLEYDNIIATLWEEYELTRSAAEQLREPLESRTSAEKELRSVRGAIKALGSINVDAIEEYKQVSERYEFLSGQIADIENSRRQLTGLITELTGEMRETFLKSFHEIDRHFRKIFVELFGGGTAALSLTDEDNVLESGIDIHVEPPGKIIRSLQSLSGGEQAFIAIAIYLAILKVRPSPFCVLDEIEAALDEVNVYKYAAYLKRMTGKTQFITITHRRGTMEESDVLYGVTMQKDGVSKLLKLDVNETLREIERAK